MTPRGIQPISRKRPCVVCDFLFDTPHRGAWPPAFCSAACHRIANPKAKPKAARSVRPASARQRVKVLEHTSIVSATGPCDPAHLWPRGLGGCDDPLCVVPLTRAEHRAFDEGRLDLLPYLIAGGRWAEIAHMIDAHHADPVSVLQRLTGQRWAPTRTMLAEEAA